MRGYEYDAFTSHNSFDGASNLAKLLEGFGTRIYCDEATDLSDRNVRGRIGQALMRSRFVIVHVPDDFRDSEWCKAEYRSALALTDTANGIIRVVVARAGSAAPVPSALAAVPIFEVPDRAADLSSYLIDGNTVPGDIAREMRAQQEGHYGAKLGTQPHQRMDTYLLEEASVLRGYFDRKECPLSAEEINETVEIGQFYIDASGYDDRTNGHRILILAAALTNDPKLMDAIKRYICREQHSAVLRVILWLYFYCNLRAEPQDVWLVAALLRATDDGVHTVENAESFLSNFPTAVRCRVIQGALDLLDLGPDEKAYLLAQRLKRLQEDNSSLGLEPFEIEGQLRELSHHLDEPLGDDNARELLGLYVSLVHDVLVWAEQRNGEPIRRMGEYACDVLLDPLARSMAGADASLVDFFERACDLVQKYTNSPTLVGDIRDAGRLVQRGGTWVDAQAMITRRHEAARTSAFAEATGQRPMRAKARKQ